MLKKINISKRFLILFTLYVLLAILSRILFLNIRFDISYLNFLSGLITPPLCFYFIVSFNLSNHTWKQLLLLVFGLTVFQIVTVESYDYSFLAKIIGLLLSIGLCSFTFIGRINNWFLNKKPQEVTEPKF